MGAALIVGLAQEVLEMIGRKEGSECVQGTLLVEVHERDWDVGAGSAGVVVADGRAGVAPEEHCRGAEEAGAGDDGPEDQDEGDDVVHGGSSGLGS